jgi:uncharacterized pyridoxamine 5'-phosphate oxidase family protein
MKHMHQALRAKNMSWEQSNKNGGGPTKKQTLDAYPRRRKMYNENDSNMVVWYLKNATAAIESLSGENRTLKF